MDGISKEYGEDRFRKQIKLTINKGIISIHTIMFMNNNTTTTTTTERFRKKFSLEERTIEAENIMKLYPDRLPVIIELHVNNEFSLARKKYLVEKDMLLSSFAFTIRTRMHVPPESSLFFMCNNSIPRFNDSMYTIHQQYKGRDNFLVIDVMKEHTFGLKC